MVDGDGQKRRRRQTSRRSSAENHAWSIHDGIRRVGRETATIPIILHVVPPAHVGRRLRWAHRRLWTLTFVASFTIPETRLFIHFYFYMLLLYAYAHMPIHFSHSH
jgi:hypothetical protein